MKQIAIAAALIISVFSFAACNDKDPVFIGGKGGNGELLLSPKHHTRYIDSCIIYIKYHTRDAASSYDDSAVCVNNGSKPVAVFSGLKKGDYYLYGYGYDTAIHQTVKGGIPFTITDETVIATDVPVTEGD